MNRPVPSTARSAGEHIRAWRNRRRLSQLDFALEVEISQKHLSFIESGRSSPSRDMVLRLAEHLDVPLRERNVMLLAAGYAPVFPERSLDDPALKAARAAIDLVLKGHEPFPALAVDRHWTLVAANSVAPAFFALVGDATLLQPPVNVLRLSLSPDGLAPHIVNLAEWRAHVLDRLRHQIEVTADARLDMLLTELQAYPSPAVDRLSDGAAVDYAGIAIPFRLRTPRGVLSFLSTTTVFGTPIDITLSELAIEAFFPADEATADAARALASSSNGGSGSASG
jgi:transcriptional regulator with XRE-family HTH domain